MKRPNNSIQIFILLTPDIIPTLHKIHDYLWILLKVKYFRTKGIAFCILYENKDSHEGEKTGVNNSYCQTI